MYNCTWPDPHRPIKHLTHVRNSDQHLELQLMYQATSIYMIYMISHLDSCGLWQFD